MGHVLSVGTVFSTLEATGTLQSTRSPPVLLFLRSVFLSPSLRLVVSAYERNSGPGPTDEQLCSSSRERETVRSRFTGLDITLLVRRIAGGSLEQYE